MAKHMKHAEGGTVDKHPRRTARELRRLERRLAETREQEARRARKVEQARADGAPREVASRRERKLERAHRRGAALEARIAALQSSAPGSVPITGDGVAPVVVAAEEVRAYCLRERMTVVIMDPAPVEMRNGRRGVAGICPGCGSRVVRPS